MVRDSVVVVCTAREWVETDYLMWIRLIMTGPASVICL